MSSPVAEAARIGSEIAGPVADDVDRKARFPAETISAVRDAGLLAAAIPEELGGSNATMTELAGCITQLGRHCASSAMIFAMHQLEIACLVQHGHSDYLRSFLSRVSSDGLLLASATTELGIGGDVRSSTCAVERTGSRFRLEKETPVISYGQQADAILVTARRTPDSPPSDQVLVVCERSDTKLEPRGGWDTIGFRGTCSPGFHLEAEGDADAILPVPFGDIAAETMLPVSHTLWSAVWLGLARAATDTARRFVQSEARKATGTTPPSARRLAELEALYYQMAASVSHAAQQLDAAAGDRAELAAISGTISMNSLKVATSTLVIEIVSRALLICGMAGYREDSPYSMSRLLRDAYGGSVMVNNDRILNNTSQLLLIHRDS